MARDRGWAFEHRVVAYDMGWLKGRDDRRHVHHRNHIKTDNRPENLEVVEPEQHGQRHRTIDWERAPDMYRDGMTTVEIAATLGTFPGNVSRRLREMGVAMERPWDRNRVLVDQTSVAQLHALGWRPPRIAAHLGVGTMVIRRVMRELGLPSFRAGRPGKAYERPTR